MWTVPYWIALGLEESGFGGLNRCTLRVASESRT